MSVKLNHIWIIVWIFIFLLGLKINFTDVLGNKGINIIQNEYYRFFTGLLLHVNIIHLLANVITIYFVVAFLFGQVNSLKLLLFSTVVGVFSNFLFSMIYRDSLSVGGSPIIFAMLGLLLVLQLLNKDIARFSLETLQAKWIIGYAILSNIPFFSGNISTFVLHIISFMIAVIFGFIGISLKLL